MLPRRLSRLPPPSARRFISLGPSPSPKPLPPSAPPHPTSTTFDSPEPEPEEGTSPPPVLPHRLPLSYVPSPPPTTLLGLLPTYFRPSPLPSDISKPNALNAFSAGPHEDPPLPVLNARDQGNESTFVHARKNMFRFLFRGAFLFVGVTAASAYTIAVAKAGWAEYWGMRAPTSLLEPDPEGGEQGKWEGRRDEAGGFELDGGWGWSGGLQGGTDQDQLGQFGAGQQLRQAWLEMRRVEEMEYDLQLRQDNTNKTKTKTTTPKPSTTSSDGSLTSVDQTSVVDETLDSLFEFFTRELQLDPRNTSTLHQGGAPAAELFLSYATTYALRQTPHSVRFPPLPSSSSSSDLLPLPSPVSPPPHLRRPRTKEHEVGQAITLKHAEAWEEVATEESLVLARNAYEGVLRDVVGVRGAETLEGRLAERLGRLERMIEGGDGGRGEDWVVWGIARLCGWDGRGVRGGGFKLEEGRDASNENANATKRSVASRIASFLPSSWSTLTNTTTAEPTPDPTDLITLSTSLSDPSSPPTSQQPRLITLLPPLPSLLSSLDPTTLPPARLRTLLSLLLTLSSLQSKPTSLPTAHATQLAIQDLLARSLLPTSAHEILDPDVPDTLLLTTQGGLSTALYDARQRFRPPKRGKRSKSTQEVVFEKGKRAASERLHQLSLLLDEAVVGLHEAEVRFAMRRYELAEGGKGGMGGKSGKGRKREKREVEETEQEVVERVQEALLKASKVLHLLYEPSRTKTEGGGEGGMPGWLPIPPPKIVLPTEPGSQFTSYSILAQPAQKLVDSAARASASAANLLGLLAMAGIGVDASLSLPPTTPTAPALDDPLSSSSTLPTSTLPPPPSTQPKPPPPTFIEQEELLARSERQTARARAQTAKKYFATAGTYSGAYLSDDPASPTAWIGTTTYIGSRDWAPWTKRRMVKQEWLGYQQRWERVRGEAV